MGTSGAVGVVVDGERKSSYCHYDAYPSHLGVHVLAQAKSIVADLGLEAARKQARDMRMISAEADPPTEKDMKELAPFFDERVGGEDDGWYRLTRKLQGDLLTSMMVGVMLDAGDFADDHGCEWAYMVDLDLEILTVTDADGDMVAYRLSELPDVETFLQRLEGV